MSHPTAIRSALRPLPRAAGAGPHLAPGAREGSAPRGARPPARLRQVAAVLLVAAAWLWGSPAPADGRKPAGEEARTPTQRPSAADPQRREGVSVVAASRTLERIWWNQPKMVDGLELRTEQRSAMDRHLVAFLDQRQAAAHSHLALRRRLADSLAAGDWEAAQGVGTEMAEIAASVAAAEANLVLQVVRELDAGQRQRLDRLYPRLLSVPWVRAGGPTRLRSGAVPVAPRAGRDDS